MIYTRLTALDQCDFDGLFAASLPYLMGKNMRWPAGLDDAGRINMVRDAIAADLAHPRGLVMACRRNGADASLMAGLVDHGTAHIRYVLAAPVAGSRGWVYDADQAAAAADFWIAQGITHLHLTMPIGSSLAAVVRARYPHAPAPRIDGGQWHQHFAIAKD